MSRDMRTEIIKALPGYNSITLHSWSEQAHSLLKHRALFEEALAIEQNNLRHLREQLSTTNKSWFKKYVLKLEIKTQQDKIKNLEHEIADKKKQYESTNKNIEDAKSFFKRVDKKPNELCKELVEFAQSKFDEFERLYPAGQSDSIRLALYRIQDKMNLIATSTTLSLTIKDWQIRYLQLNGLLQQMLMDTLDQNQYFYDCLITILKAGHLGMNGDLPTLTGQANLTGKGCDDYFKKLAELNSELYQANIELLKKIEQQKFENAYKTLLNTVQPRCVLDSQGKALALMLHAQMLKEKKNLKSIDLKYYTQILEQTTLLMLNPMDNKAYQRFNELYVHAVDKGSKAEKIRGLLIGFAGLALIAIAFCFFALTGNTAIANSGIRIGIILFKLGAEICLAASGLVLTLKGANLFQQGMATGVAKGMQQFSNILEKKRAAAEQLQPQVGLKPSR